MNHLIKYGVNVTNIFIDTHEYKSNIVNIGTVSLHGKIDKYKKEAMERKPKKTILYMFKKAQERGKKR